MALLEEVNSIPLFKLNAVFCRELVDLVCAVWKCSSAYVENLKSG